MAVSLCVPNHASVEHPDWICLSVVLSFTYNFPGYIFWILGTLMRFSSAELPVIINYNCVIYYYNIKQLYVCVHGDIVCVCVLETDFSMNKTVNLSVFISLPVGAEQL